MISKEENELLCCTGLCTPMGELFRRFSMALPYELPNRIAPRAASDPLRRPDCVPRYEWTGGPPRAVLPLGGGAQLANRARAAGAPLQWRVSRASNGRSRS